MFGIRLVFASSKQREHDSFHNQENQQTKDGEVVLSLYSALLVTRLGLVLHKFCIVAGVDHNANNPVCVAKDRSLQEQVCFREAKDLRGILGPRREVEVTVEGI